MKRTVQPTQTVFVSNGTGIAALNDDIRDGIAEDTIGVFSAETGLALTAASDAQAFFIAMGVKGNDFVDNKDIEGIKPSQVRDANIKCFQSAQSAVVGVKFTSTTKIYCDRNYTMRVRLGSHRVRQFYGLAERVETYTTTPQCCTTCDTADCREAELIDVIKNLIAQVNQDNESEISATVYEPTNSNAIVTDLDAFWADTTNKTEVINGVTYLQAGVELGIMIQAKDALFKARYGEFDYDWAPFAAQDISVSIMDALLDCDVAEKVEIRPVIFDQGTSKQVAMDEFEGMGNLQTPTRYLHGGNHTTPLNRSNRSSQKVIDGEKYDCIDIEYRTVANWGTGEIPNDLRATIYVPCEDKVAVTNPLVATINKMLGTTLTTADCPACTTVTPLFYQEVKVEDEAEAEGDEQV